MLQVSEKDIKNRLLFDNPWWTGSISSSDEYRDYPRRDYIGSFIDLVVETEINRAVILMGPRRVGKTVMLYQTIHHLLDVGVVPINILYLSLETPVYTGKSLEQLVQMFLTEHDHEQNSRLYIFFDEIQYLKNWEVHLKSLVDSYPKYRFIATGSAAAALKLKSQESGAGRFTDFLLPPLTFSEFLKFVNLELLLVHESDIDRQYETTDINKLNEQFIRYLNYGGYPEAVFSQKIQADSARYIKSDIIDKVLLRDLPSLYGIQDIQELNSLFTTVAYNTGSEISIDELSQTSNVATNTIKKYLDYLEAAFLIRRINRVDENARHFSRKRHFKVYLTNPSIRAALFGPVDQEHEAMGSIAETAIFSQWLHSTKFIDQLYYARWKGGKEIDIIGVEPVKQKAQWVVEVKWTDRFYDRPGELNSIIEFTKKNKLSRIPLVTTKTASGFKKSNDIEMEFSPCSLHCYTIGKNVLKEH